MQISFTGTRKGMTEYQRREITRWLESANQVTHVSHGGAEGADLQFHSMLRRVLGKSVLVTIYPSSGRHLIATMPTDAVVLTGEAPLKRNKKIVAYGKDLLLAVPKENKEVLRSGTWMTIRYAKKIGVPVLIFWPEQIQ